MKKLLLILALLSASCSAQILRPIVNGASAAGCTLVASNGVGFNDGNEAAGLDTNNFQAGMRFDASFPVTGNVCKVTFQLTAVGTVSGLTYTATIWSVSAGNLNALLGTSASVTGNNSWSHTLQDFTFASPVALSSGGTYAIVVTPSAVAGGGVYTGVDYRTDQAWAGFTVSFSNVGVVGNFINTPTVMRIYTQ